MVLSTPEPQPEHQVRYCPNCGAEAPLEANFCTTCGSALGAMSQPNPEPQPDYQVHYCFTHPDVETGLSCTRCEKYICPRCMVQSPVGARCGECAQVRRLPTFDVTPLYYLRASAAGVGVAVAAGVIWGLLRIALGGFGLLPGIIGIGVGYLIGEAISRSVNQKRGTGLAWTAGTSVALAFVISGLVWEGAPGLRFLLSRGIFGLLSLGIAVFVAVKRVR